MIDAEPRVASERAARRGYLSYVVRQWTARTLMAALKVLWAGFVATLFAAVIILVIGMSLSEPSQLSDRNICGVLVLAFWGGVTWGLLSSVFAAAGAVHGWKSREELARILVKRAVKSQRRGLKVEALYLPHGLEPVLRLGLFDEETADVAELDDVAALRIEDELVRTGFLSGERFREAMQEVSATR